MSYCFLQKNSILYCYCFLVFLCVYISRSGESSPEFTTIPILSMFAFSWVMTYDNIHCQKQTPFYIHNWSATMFAPDIHVQKISATVRSSQFTVHSSQFTVHSSQITSWKTISFFVGSYQKSGNTLDAHLPYKEVSSHWSLFMCNTAEDSTRNAVHLAYFSLWESNQRFSVYT